MPDARDGLWSLIQGTEVAPADAALGVIFQNRKSKALAMIVLSINGTPEDPKVVWDLLAAQFQKKSWANRFAIKVRLTSTKLQTGGDVQLHLKAMTELMDEASIVEREPVNPGAIPTG